MDGTPLLSAIDTTLLPLDFITPPGDIVEALSAIVITAYTETTNLDDTVTSEYELSFAEEVRFDITGLDGLEFILGEDATSPVTIGWTAGSQSGYTIYLLGALTLRFQNSLFVPVVKSGDAYLPDPNKEHLEIALSAGVELDQDMALTFNGGNRFQLTPVMIGDSGVVIEGEIAFDLSPTEALPESLALGYTAAWKGVVFNTLTVYLPDALDVPILPGELHLADFHIGNGGITGEISGSWSNAFDAAAGAFVGDGVGELFGFAFALQEIVLSFRQNTLVESAISGSLHVPFFDDVLEIELGLTNEGGYTVAIGGGVVLAKPGVLSVAVDSLAFIEEAGEFLVQFSGSITPELADIAWPTFTLDSLAISPAGRVKVAGGWLELPEQQSLDFYGFKVEVSQLGFGTEEAGGDDYNWIGLSGGIQLFPALPLRGGIEGLKVMWNQVTGAPLLQVGGVSLAYEVESVLAFEGVARFIDEEDPNDATARVRGFKGGVEVGLVPLNGAGFDAQFITGKRAQYKFFYLFLDVALPIGIPLFPPALGLYGLAGLFAYNMTLDYPALVDYEDNEPRPEMTDIANWIDEEGALAFGAGVTLGTLADNGFTTRAKVLLAILVPGPVILIEGYSSILTFTPNYPYRVLAVLDVPSGTFLMNIDARYAFPKSSGDLVDAHATAEAFFPLGDLSGWHLYLGQDSPDSKRIQAEVLRFFTAQAYLMVEQEGLALGAWIGYSLDEKYGVLRVVLESWISGDLAVSWMPLQALGTFTWAGHAELSVAKIGLGLSVEATASVEVPRPISITGSLTVQLKTPVGKPKATLKLKWKTSGVPPLPMPLAATLGIEHRKVAESWDVPKSSEYGTDADGLWDETSGQAIRIPESDLPLVPPDVFLTLNFDKSVVDTGLVGGNNPDVPANEVAGAYEYQYELLDVALESSGSWNDVPAALSWTPFEDAGSGYSLTAAWQALPDPQGMPNTKLVVNALSSLEISRLLEENNSWLLQLSLANPGYPCPEPVEAVWDVVNFETHPFGEVLHPMFVEEDWLFLAAFPMRVQEYDAPWLGTQKALTTLDELEEVRCLLIRDVEPTGQQSLFTTGGLFIHAGGDPGAYVQYRVEPYPVLDYLRHTELYIHEVKSSPAAITFPALLFPSWPDEVWLTVAVADSPATTIIARDASGAKVDQITDFSDCARNPFTYMLRSSKGNPIRTIEFEGNDFQVKELCWNEYAYTDVDRLWIYLPEEMHTLILDLSKGSQGTVSFLDEEEQAVGEAEFDIPTDAGPAPPLKLDVEHLAFKLLLIEGEFALLQVRGLPQASVDAVEDYEERSTHLHTTLEENWGQHTAQILLPNTYYRLRVETRTRRRKKGNSAWSKEQTFTEYLYFRTGDPPGIPDPALTPAGAALEPSPASEHYPAGGPLADLAPYVERTIPAGAPPNEPQVLHYRSYDVGVVFNDSYLEQMYHAAGYALGIKLLDNNGQAVLTADGNELFLNGWGSNPTLALTREEAQYETFWENCVGFSPLTAPESTQELLASDPALDLLPQTQYKAQLWAGEAHCLYEFAFMTSRYASFLHHVHTFQDAVWDHLALLDDPAFAIDPAALTAALHNASGVEEWVQFEQLMEVFDLNPRPLPQQVEIALLQDSQQSYGLLLESPEPLPAARVQTITLALKGAAATIPEFAGTLKLTGAAVSPLLASGQGGTPDYNTQWVEVLLLEEADLSGYRLEYRDRMAAEDDPFTLYYTFAPGSVYPAGTRLLIYNGAPPATPASSEHVHLYAEHATTLYALTGTGVRLVTAEDVVAHQRPFFPDRGYTVQDIHVIRNQDETRLFLFIKEPGAEYADLPSGVYRLSLTFSRDTGGDEPPLMRFGYPGPEEAQLSFSLPPLLP